MGLPPAGLEEDTQQLQHGAPRCVEFVRQAFLHGPARVTVTVKFLLTWAPIRKSMAGP